MVGVKKGDRVAIVPKVSTPKVIVPSCIVSVNRNHRSFVGYPEWAEALANPELECVGPTKYDLAKLDLHLYFYMTSVLSDKRQDIVLNIGVKSIKGDAIYLYLIETATLKNCLGYDDALAIQEKGIVVFKKFFQNRALFFWRSVVRERDTGRLRVPCIYHDSQDVVLGWVPLSYDFGDNRPAVRWLSQVL